MKSQNLVIRMIHDMRYNSCIQIPINGDHNHVHKTSVLSFFLSKIKKREGEGQKKKKKYTSARNSILNFINFVCFRIELILISIRGEALIIHRLKKCDMHDINNNSN